MSLFILNLQVNLDENGCPQYELSLEPHNHICAPSPIQHLVKIFSERCYKAVAKNPTREIGNIYQNIRTEMTNGMSDDDRLIFLEDIPDKNAIAPRLYDHRRVFIPKAPADFVSIKNSLSKKYVYYTHALGNSRTTISSLF